MRRLLRVAAFLALLVCLLAASSGDEWPYQPSPLPSHVLGARTAVAVVTHKPTPAMLRRWCHLRTERACSSFKANWFILYVVQHAESELNYREWCEGSAPVVVLRKEDYATIYGENGARYWDEGHEYPQLHEAAFHALHATPGPGGNATHRADGTPILQYDHLWVFEQDVGWQGNLFDALGTFATWRHDLLVENMFVPPNSAFDQRHQLHAWARESLKEHLKAWVFCVRYSRRLLATLAFEFAMHDKVGYCEWWAPSICRYQSLLTSLGVANYSSFEVKPLLTLPHRNEWPAVPKSMCTIADIGSERYLYHPKAAISPTPEWPALFHGAGPTFRGEAGFTDREASFNYSLDAPAMLFHAVKYM